MQIKTQRLKIRTLQDSDLNDVFDIYKDEETCKYLLHNSWNEKNKNEEFKEKLSKQSLEKDFAINLACILDDVVIGEINIWNTQMKDCVEIGYCFNPKYGNKGYATEALKGVDIIYGFSKDDIERQGLKTLEKIYQDTSWMDKYKMDFYKTKENHKKHREDALKGFLKDYNSNDYIYCELPNLPFKNKEFDLLLSSHLFFVYDDRLDFNFHKNSILEMLRV